MKKLQPWKGKINSNIEHMRIEHGFFIPDKLNCNNIEGLITRIAKKVLLNTQCLYCEHDKHKNFKSAGDAQNHMKDMGHCMINIDYIGEFNDFYDYTKDNMQFIEKYFDKIDENVEEGVAEYKPKKELMDIQYKLKDNGEFEDWLDVDENEETENDSFKNADINDSNNKTSELSFKEINSNTSDLYSFTKVKIGDQILNLKDNYHFKNFMIDNAQKTSIGELILPNKKLIGTKDYALYYKQNYPSQFLFDNDQLLRILEDKGVVSKSEALVKYNYQDLKKLYLTTIQNEKHAENEKLKAEKKINEKFNKNKNFLKTKRHMNSDSRHNAILTKHYREQNLAFN